MSTSNNPNTAAPSVPSGIPRSNSTTHALSLGVANAAASPSTAGSARSSRESSPHPTQQNSQPPTRSRGLRSRKNSHDLSPSRPPSINSAYTVPSAASIQRALSAAATPPLTPNSFTDPSIPNPPKLSRLPRSTGSTGDNTPHWPLSPRLKSPPPSNNHSRRNSLLAQTRRSEPSLSAPSIVVQQPSPTPSLTTPSGKGNGDSEPDELVHMTMKPSGRGASGAVQPKLETVAEGSLPTTPGALSGQEPPTRYFSQSAAVTPEKSLKRSDSSTKISRLGESESESGGNQSDGKRTTASSKQETDNEATPRPKPVLSARTSYSALVPARSRAGTEASSIKNMTVETETVSSIPQAALGAPADRSGGRSDPSGSLRLMPSTETIRPKKDRKKATRKAPSIHSGTASSKADIFEQKVATAVDEAAHSSDSDETFVYESNPPESQPRRSRNHSRTPSATSMASMANTNQRNISSMHDTHRVAGKRSMKFTNNPYNSADPESNDVDRATGTVRAGTSRPGGSGSIHHHHIGRFGRGTPSRPNSPRFSNHSRQASQGVKKSGEYLGTYNLDDDGADDETTPLVGTVRRNGRGSLRSRPVGYSGSIRQHEWQQERQRSWLSRCAGCVVFIIMLLLVVFGAMGFFFAMTKPLYEVAVNKIENVLASEQEIMLDLVVDAINPNVIGVTIYDMDVNIFAKSKHVGSEKWWREHQGQLGASSIFNGTRSFRRQQEAIKASSQDNKPKTRSFWPPWHTHEDDDYDDPYPPFPDPSGDAQTMLLGRIFHFDSPLTFDGSPIKRHQHQSTGELRLAKPGNKTEMGGTERWERVIQFPFELIVRGILKYQLPLSSRMHTTPIGASVVVHPEKGVDQNGRMYVEKYRVGWEQEWEKQIYGGDGTEPLSRQAVDDARLGEKEEAARQQT